MSWYDIREAEINDNLRRIYSERYELIKMSDVKLRNENEVLKTLFMSNVMKAKFRNDMILRECDKIVKDVGAMNKYNKEQDKRFKILKNNYLSMAKSIYPEWSREYDEYKKRRNAFAIQYAQQQQQQQQQQLERSTHSTKTISKSLPNVERDESSLTSKPSSKRRRTPRELMNEIAEKSAAGGEN